MSPSPRRIVSLVPSLTETLVHFGLADRLVGRTRYCEEPSDVVSGIPAFGGTKNPEVEEICALAPDLIVVNREENRIEDYRRFQEAGLRLHITHPRGVVEAIDMIEELGAVVNAQAAASAMAAQAHQALDAAVRRCARSAAPVPVFCPIWRRPWMTFGRRTYVDDVLRSVGCVNVFGGEGKPDFFEIELNEVVAADPALILLPDEPYAFGPQHEEELRAAGLGAAVRCIDGKDLSWYGPRLAGALSRLVEIVVPFAGR